MRKVRPPLLLIKPRPARTESDCELEALRFLRSWKRARERLAIQKNDAEPIEATPIIKSKGSAGASAA